MRIVTSVDFEAKQFAPGCTEKSWDAVESWGALLSILDDLSVISLFRLAGRSQGQIARTRLKTGTDSKLFDLATDCTPLPQSSMLLTTADIARQRCRSYHVKPQ